MKKMQIMKGDTVTFSCVATVNGEILDLTGYTMKYTAKRNPKSDDNMAEIDSTAVIADPSSGTGVFTLLPDDTELVVGKDRYDYDVQISNGIDNVYTLCYGKLTVLQDVRHART